MMILFQADLILCLLIIPIISVIILFGCGKSRVPGGNFTRKRSSKRHSKASKEAEEGSSKIQNISSEKSPQQIESSKKEESSTSSNSDKSITRKKRFKSKIRVTPEDQQTSKQKVKKTPRKDVLKEQQSEKRKKSKPAAKVLQRHPPKKENSDKLQSSGAANSNNNEPSSSSAAAPNQQQESDKPSPYEPISPAGSELDVRMSDAEVEKVKATAAVSPSPKQPQKPREQSDKNAKDDNKKEEEESNSKKKSKKKLKKKKKKSKKSNKKKKDKKDKEEKKEEKPPSLDATQYENVFPQILNEPKQIHQNDNGISFMSKLNQKPTGVTATEEMGFEIPTDTYLTGVNPRKLQAYLNQRDPTMLTGYEIIGNDGKKAYIAPRPSPLKVEQIKKEPVYDPLKTAEPKITNSELQQVKEVKRGITKKERSVTPRLLKIKPAKQLPIYDLVKNDKSKLQTSTVLVEPIASRSLELEPTRELNEHVSLKATKPKKSVMPESQLKPVKPKKSVISEPQQQNEEEIIALNAHNTSPQSPPPPPSTTSGSTTTTIIASELPIEPPQKVQVRKVEREHTPPQSTSTTTCSTTTASEVPTQDLQATTTTPTAAPRPINLTIKLSVHDPLKTAKTKSAATSKRQEIHESQAGTNTADFATLPTRTKSNPTTCTTTECETLSNSKCSTTTLTSASSAPN